MFVENSQISFIEGGRGWKGGIGRGVRGGGGSVGGIGWRGGKCHF